ncbi:MAG: DUF2797 domain-containing protein [Candidatus Aenigmarchaeota archaeon]|nr:DUF2797 domain-containing protein [Candidatus Aenigmarchaeota archaeon]
MQIMKYSWINWEPFLIVDDHGMRGMMKLFDSQLDINVGKKYCIGYRKKGKWNPCRTAAEIASGYYCNECKLEDEFFMCVTCDGSACVNTLQREGCEKNAFYIYLAAFDNLLKVGISYEHRLLERLVEQGADFAAKIGKVQDGKRVRQVEQDIKNHLGIVDRVFGNVKQELIFGNPNASLRNIRNAVTSLQTNGFGKHLVTPEIYDLRRYYRLEQLSSHPHSLKLKDGMLLRGKALAAKGNIIMVQDGNQLYSVNSHDLIGREITMGSQKTLIDFVTHETVPAL